MKPSSHMPQKPRRRTSFLLLLSTTLALLALSSSSDSSVHAQAFSPQSARRMGYAQMDDLLYIQGGFDTAVLDQFMALDLSTSWSTGAPAWKQLKDGETSTHMAIAPIAQNSNGGSKGSLLSIAGMNNDVFMSLFDVGANSWTNLAAARAPFPRMEGHVATTDPNTGLIYIIGGNGDKVYNSMVIFDPKSRTVTSSQPATLATSLVDLTAVWSTTRNTIVTFGGTRAPPAPVQAIDGGADLNEYDPSSKTWKTMTTSGDVPPARLDHCMAASEDGSKIVLYGGTSDGDNFFNTIYILDVASGKWKQGQNSPIARTRMACGFRAHQFIAWGGSSAADRKTLLNNVPIIYNLNQDKWVEQYNADETEKKSSIGGIIGGVVAVAAVAGVAVFLVMRRRKRRQEEERAFQSETMVAAAVADAEDDSHKIKVLAEDVDYSNNPYYNGNNYQGSGNEYPLNNMDGTSSSANYQNGSEKMNSPNAHYYGAASPSYPQHSALQSPAAVYQQHQHHYPNEYEYPSGSGAGVQGTDGNPFMSSEDYAQQQHLKALTAHSPSPNPFLAASDASYHQTSPHQQHYDPFQTPQHSSPSLSTASPGASSAWPAYSYNDMQSPTPGARAPQVIPEGPVMGYVPPPPNFSS